MKACWLVLLLMMVNVSIADSLPKVAVTDLTYEQRLSQYINYTAYNQRSSSNSAHRDSARDGYDSYSESNSGRSNQRSESSYVSTGAYVTYIDRGEIRKFTNDIKGEMLKSGSYKLVQAKPYTLPNKTEEIFDVIQRIKNGYYKGADYVLFGTLSNIEFRNEENPIQGTDSLSRMLSLELVADFSLINTKTYEVTSAFSAIGEATDTKLVRPGANLTPSRGRVISEVSKSLGADVIRQLDEQNPAKTAEK